MQAIFIYLCWTMRNNGDPRVRPALREAIRAMNEENPKPRRQWPKRRAVGDLTPMQ